MSADPPAGYALVVTATCGECGAAMSRDAFWWYCANCHRDEASAAEAADEDARERADADYEAHPPGCTCRDFDETQCDVHGPAVIAQMAAEHERARLREALATIVAMPDAWSGVPWQRLCRWAARVLAEMERDR